MKKLFALLASAVLAAAAIPKLSPAQQTVSAADKIKILPAGDSITFGMGDDGGYRKYLDVTLKQKNIDFDMVGPEGPDTASFNYNGQNVTYDNNHAGYSGYTIKYHAGGYGDGLMETLQKKNAIKSGQPDIILLIIGTNDMNSNRSMEECEKDLRELMDDLRARQQQFRYQAQ